jgi:hypothetical protein
MTNLKFGFVVAAVFVVSMICVGSYREGHDPVLVARHQAERAREAQAQALAANVPSPQDVEQRKREKEDWDDVQRSIERSNKETYIAQRNLDDATEAVKTTRKALCDSNPVTANRYCRQ